MKVFLNNFFHDMDLTPFYRIFQTAFNEKVELGSTIEECDILLESVFGSQIALYRKKWKYSFLFIGESDRRLPIFIGNRLHTMKDYSCVLKGEHDVHNVVNFPLYVLYSYSYQHTYSMLKRSAHRVTRIPPKDVCVIISNGGDAEGRSQFCELLERYVKVDYAGNYKNNVPRITHNMFSPEFIDSVSQYKVIITMENSKNKTYITEKILHGFVANIVPVYWGSDYIQDYFNEDRYINVKSWHQDDVGIAIERIVELLRDEEKYLHMVNQPVYKNNRIPLTGTAIANHIKRLFSITTKPKNTLITVGTVQEGCDLAFFYNVIGYDNVDSPQHLVKDALEKMNENDVVVFCNFLHRVDSMDWKDCIGRMDEYMDMLNMDKGNRGILLFRYGDTNEFPILIVKKSENTFHIVNTWCSEGVFPSIEAFIQLQV